MKPFSSAELMPVLGQDAIGKLVEESEMGHTAHRTLVNQFSADYHAGDACMNLLNLML